MQFLAQAGEQLEYRKKGSGVLEFTCGGNHARATAKDASASPPCIPRGLVRPPASIATASRARGCAEGCPAPPWSARGALALSDGGALMR
jgi:hypothetical protein